MVLEERVKILKELIKQENIYKVNSIKENVDSIALNEILKIEPKPTLEKLEKIENNLLAIKNDNKTLKAVENEEENEEDKILDNI